MCAYNVRQNKRVDRDPATGEQRTRNLFREIGIWLLCLGAMYLVYWLSRTYLF
ncbi:MAG TPA: hypothetical protein VMG41_12335 [Gemmatimonadales bacterium]|nr:hypothetical protein [Gemmatimonadales bacterium]